MLGAVPCTLCLQDHTSRLRPPTTSEAPSVVGPLWREVSSSGRAQCPVLCRARRSSGRPPPARAGAPTIEQSSLRRSRPPGDPPPPVRAGEDASSKHARATVLPGRTTPRPLGQGQRGQGTQAGPRHYARRVRSAPPRALRVRDPRVPVFCALCWALCPVLGAVPCGVLGAVPCSHCLQRHTSRPRPPTT